MFDSYFVCSNCSPSAFVVLFSQSVRLLTALFIGFCGRLSQITCSASLRSVIDLELVTGLRYRAPDMVVHGASESGGHWSFVRSSGS